MNISSSQSSQDDKRDLEKNNQILKHGVQILHRKLDETKREKESTQRTLREREYEVNVLKERANSNEVKARGLEAAQERIHQLELALLKYAMGSDL